MDDQSALKFINDIKTHLMKKSDKLQDEYKKIAKVNGEYVEIDDNSREYICGYSDGLMYAWAALKNILYYTPYDTKEDD